MRELTVRIRFTQPCLGNVKTKDGSGRFLLPRNPRGYVTFLASWHHANMYFASQILGLHQDEVKKILWDIQVDGCTKRDCWHKRYYVSQRGRKHYALHESFQPGQVVGINCVVPGAILDDDLWRLMQLAGKYKGISPWKPGEFGFYEVESIRPRRAVPLELGPSQQAVENTKGQVDCAGRPGPL